MDEVYSVTAMKFGLVFPSTQFSYVYRYKRNLFLIIKNSFSNVIDVTLYLQTKVLDSIMCLFLFNSISVLLFP